MLVLRVSASADLIGCVIPHPELIPDRKLRICNKGPDYEAIELPLGMTAQVDGGKQSQGISMVVIS